MPATTVIMLYIPSVGLNFADTMLRNGKIMPATTVIMLNIPSVGLNFADIMLRNGKIMPTTTDIMPNFGFRDPIPGLLEP